MLSVILLLTLSAVALAMGGDPQTLFTDNITATGTSIAVTEMEQQLLNRLNGDRDGKYDKDGRRVALPFQTVETINETAQQRHRTLDLFSAGCDPEWRNRLIWGDKKYVLPSLLKEFAGQVNLIYIDPPFDVGADFSFTAMRLCGGIMTRGVHQSSAERVREVTGG